MTLDYSLADVLILTLACWRVAYLMAKEAAPFHLMAKLRARTTLGGLLTCLYCSSIWAAVAVLLLWHTPLQFVVWIAAVSGAALMLGNYTGASQQ